MSLRLGRPAFGLLLCVASPGWATTIIPVAATKLVVVDRLAASGKGKVTYVAKDSNAGIEIGNDRGARFDIAYGSAHGAFNMSGNGGGGVPWVIRTPAHVSKFVRGDRARPPSQVKVLVLRQDELIKFVAKGVGDEPIDIVSAGMPTGGVLTSLCLATLDDVSICHCSEFQHCVYKDIAGGTGAKLVCKDGVGDASCAAFPSSFSHCCDSKFGANTCTVTSHSSLYAFLEDRQQCYLLGNLGALDTVCGPSGTCEPSPVPAGGCCQLTSVSCRTGAVDQTACETDLLGTWFPSSVCGVSGTCE